MAPCPDQDECTNYRRVCRNKQNVYECPPPATEVMQCGVCWTAEREQHNIWSCVPFVSYTTLFGPTLADILIHILNLLPVYVINWLGIGHQKTCRFNKPNVVNNESVGGNPKKTYQYSASGDGQINTLSDWIREEYMCLSKELADLKKFTGEGDDQNPDNRDLVNARHYVLERLAEMMLKGEEIERRSKKKKQKC